MIISYIYWRATLKYSLAVFLRKCTTDKNAHWITETHFKLLFKKRTNEGQKNPGGEKKYTKHVQKPIRMFRRMNSMSFPMWLLLVGRVTARINAHRNSVVQMEIEIENHVETHNGPFFHSSIAFVSSRISFSFVFIHLFLFCYILCFFFLFNLFSWNQWTVKRTISITAMTI